RRQKRKIRGRAAPGAPADKGRWLRGAHGNRRVKTGAPGAHPETPEGLNGCRAALGRATEEDKSGVGLALGRNRRQN
ncbi:hypothetical protein CDAR_234971, partial [Caerostris darwini]